MPDGDGGPDGGGDGGRSGDLVVGRNRREAAEAAPGRGGGGGRGRHRGRDHEDGFESRGVAGLGGSGALPG